MDLLGAEAELLDAATGVAHGHHPDGMPWAVGADGATGGVTDVAMEQGAAQDLGGGGQLGGKLGTGGAVKMPRNIL